MEYDDEGSALAAAAIAYVASASKLDVRVMYDSSKDPNRDEPRQDFIMLSDPFPENWFGDFDSDGNRDESGGPGTGWDKRKKHSRVRQLVIAGALIAAEIDRVRRAEAGLSEGP